MPLTYVHLSDIHFGQERGTDVYVHDDVKDCLLDDVAALTVEAGIDRVDGVILTGDVAFSGKKNEYDRAARWLDKLTDLVGCKRTDVLVVPGNHDIDRDRITRLASVMLSQTVEGGPEELECFLKDPKAREILYEKFHDYRTFSEGYGCSLAADGRVALTRQLEIAPGRVLRFVGLNSALLCTAHGNDRGNLLVGGRQYVLPREEGCELVVLCHHPLESLQDEQEMGRYLRSRARVHIFGHLHQPSVSVESPVGEGDLLTIGAGATVPPGNEDGYQFTYNVISLAWERGTDGLEVQIVPRTWNEEETRFGADTGQLGAQRLQHTLRCPNFRTREVAAEEPAPGGDCRTKEKIGARRTESEQAPPARMVSEGAKSPCERGRGGAVGSSTDLLRLKFFRDLNGGQRIRALIDVGLLPENWAIDLTHIIERRLFDKAVHSGLEVRLASAVGSLLGAAQTVERDDGQ